MKKDTIKIYLLILLVLFTGGCSPVQYLKCAGLCSQASDLIHENAFSEGIKRYRQVVELDENGPWGEKALFEIGKIHFKLEEHKKAIRVFKDVIEKQKNYNFRTASLFMIAKCYYKLDDYMEAKSILQQVEVITSEDSTFRKSAEQMIREVEEKLAKHSKLDQISQKYTEYTRLHEEYKKTIILMLNGKLEDPEKLHLLLMDYKKSYQEYQSLLSEASAEGELAEIERRYKKEWQTYLTLIKNKDPEELDSEEIKNQEAEYKKWGAKLKRLKSDLNSH